MISDLAARLPEQRWFRAKHRRIAGVSEHDRATVGDGSLVVLAVSYVDGGPPDRYLVPTVDGREPADGDGLWTALAQAMTQSAAIPGRRGRFIAEHAGAEIDGAPGERRLRVEQSNTSVVIGDRLILKLFRLLEPGENPDLEVGAFLSDVGFDETPALAGALRYVAEDAEPAAAAMLQAYVPSRGDAWASMLEALDADPSEATRMAGDLGGLTRRLHRALASRPDDPSFPSRPATVAETASWRSSAESQLAQAIAALDGPAHDRLVTIAPAVRARFADSFGSASGDALVTRIHGDYHLGQVLARRDGGFSVIDFEGEPARPLEERCRPASPLRDVAGMLRSLDYAARTAAGDGALDADAWLADARDAFLDAYGGIGHGSAGLLDAFELEKACYEVRYEAGNRPDWLSLPLAAVERLIPFAG